MKKIIKAYQFELQPTKGQIEQIVQSVGCVRFVWNHFLHENKINYIKYVNNLIAVKPSVSYEDMANLLVSLKKQDEFSFLKQSPSQALQQTLKNLTQAFQGFFRGKNGHPVFKKKFQHDCLHFPQGFKLFRTNLGCDVFKKGTGKVYLPKIGYVDFIQHREMPDNFTVKNVYVRRKAHKWFIAFQGELEMDVSVTKSKDKLKTIALDLGIKHFFTTNQQEFQTGLHKYQHNLNKLKKLQQKLSLKTKDSNSYRKLKFQITKLHQHITNCRKDFNHKLSRYLANAYDIVVMENLNIQAMLQFGISKLNLQILDQGWYQFKTFLQYKLNWLDKHLILVNPAYTSQACSHCGHISRKNRTTQAKFCCQKCGLTLNADYNASLNILRKGLTQLSTLEHGAVLAKAITEAPKLFPLGRW